MPKRTEKDRKGPQRTETDRKGPNDDYKRSKPSILAKIAEMSKVKGPRQIYRELNKEDSFDGPRDLKQCQNVKYNERKKTDDRKKGKKTNLADEIIECISMVDEHPFVQQVSKGKGKMPNFVLYPQEQKQDLAYFLSQESNYIIGVDRTFNLGTYYVTVLVYKNLRVVRAEHRKEHPIFLGPVFIHRDADFEAYHSFFAHIKAMLCKQISIKAIEVNLGKEMYIGSDEESALTKAIESVFPSSIRMLSTRHLKDTRNYLQKKVNVPQKDRCGIINARFGEEGITNAATSMQFDRANANILRKSAKYPTFLTYFNSKLMPCVRDYVNTPSRNNILRKNWSNNNCESINNIIKLDANWKPSDSKSSINLLYEISLLRFW